MSGRWRRNVAVLNYDSLPITIDYPTYRPARLLVDAGFDVHIVGRVEPPDRKEIVGVTSWLEPSARAVARRIGELRPEFVYCEACAYGVMFGRMGRRSWHRNPPKSGRAATRLAQQVVVRWFDVLSFTNPVEQAAWKVRPEQLVDLPYPVDLPFWRADIARDPHVWSDHGLATPPGPVIVYVAGLNRGKRQVELVEAMAPLLRQRPDISLVLLGHAFDEEFHAELLATLAREAVTDQVVLTGWLNPPDVRQVLAWASLSVVYTAAETQCMTIYESLAAGVPTIITPIPELVSQFPALPAPRSPDELNATIIELLEDDGAGPRQLAAAADRVEWASRDRHDHLFRTTVERLLDRTIW